MQSDAVILPATPETLSEAAARLRSGDLVAFPTETVYGLGANALDSAAVARIFAAKGRPSTNPVIVHVADPEGATAVVAEWPEAAQKLADAFWPGPLTLVLPKRTNVPEIVTAGGSTVAVRCPAHPVARELIRLAGVPVAAPSANRSGELSPTTAAHVARSLGTRIGLILDGGACPGGVESTVIAVAADGIRLLRSGLIPESQLRSIVGGVGALERGNPVVEVPLPSPGMLTRHYAPHTALEVADTGEEAAFLAQLYTTAGLKVARWQPTGSPAEVAARLYAELHALDASGFDRIIATLPPDSEDWQAIRDRLTRAAAEPE
jgi:L-threonylcarbamoyladenylate synthase